MIVLATLLAGIYGSLHDQVTYSISSEYFTIFKFDQFGFQDWGNNNPRLTTAIIGFLATWWVLYRHLSSISWSDSHKLQTDV